MHETQASAALCDPGVASVTSDSPFAHVAVETSSGPHVTPVLYVLAGPRLWFLVPRDTLKARVLRKRPSAGVLLRGGEHSLVMGGRVRLLDPLRPQDLRGALPELALSPFAIPAYSWRNPMELLGFAGDARQPGASLPIRLLIAGFEPQRVALVSGKTIERRWGAWPDTDLPEGEPTAGGRGSGSKPSYPGLPAEVSALPAQEGPATLGLIGPDGPLALPASWDPGSAEARVPTPLIALAGIATDGAACVSFDAADSWRPTGKRGVMLRGEASIGEPDPDTTPIRIDPRRGTYWVGFDAGTVPLA